MITITLLPDMSIEPGHQFIEVADDAFGRALASLLTGIPHEHIQVNEVETNKISIAHDFIVDARIVKLLDQLAHVRYSSPSLVQMTLSEVQG